MKLSKLIDKLFDLILINAIVRTFIKIKLRFINPKLNKLKGQIIVKQIKNKGKDLRIHGQAIIMGSSKLKIGNYVRIGEGAFFSCSGGLTIGDNVQFSRNVLIYTNNHDIDSYAIPYAREYINKPVWIGNSVWIGMNVTITPGTIIEDGAIIGMGTVVSGYIPKGAIIVGAKTRIVGYRNIECFDKLKKEGKYFGLLFPDN